MRLIFVLNSFKHKIIKLFCALLRTTSFRNSPILEFMLDIGVGTFGMCVRISVYASQFDCIECEM